MANTNQSEMKWMPIESAPKHTDVLCWRDDQGVFIAIHTVPGEVMSDEEVERGDFPEDFEEWFSEVWGWLEGDLRPTHWMPLPPAPQES